MSSGTKISQLTTAGPLTGAELVPIVQSGGTLQTTLQDVKVFSLGTVENEVSILDSRVAAVSALATQNADTIASVQTDLGNLTIRVADVSASVSALNVQMVEVQASISAINSLLAAIDVSAINTLLPEVSALEIRVSAVSAAVSVNTADIAALTITVANVSARTSVNAAAITSVNNVVSALDVRLNTVSAAAVSLAFSTSILETRVSAVSAVGVLNTAAITSVNVVLANVSAQVSVVNVRVAAVSASVSVINARLPVGTVVGTSDAQVLSSKRINPRVFTTTTGVSVTPDVGEFDVYAYTALASGLTINAPVSSSPLDANRLLFRIEDNGVSRALTWTTGGTNSYRVVGVTLPTATSAGKVTYVGCLYNQADAVWDVLAVATQA
jgi:hypothetical protein